LAEASRMAGRPARQEERVRAFETFVRNLKRELRPRGDFPIFIGRNPLKSLDSEK
jgi:hypothetical protein